MPLTRLKPPSPVPTIVETIPLICLPFVPRGSRPRRPSASTRQRLPTGVHAVQDQPAGLAIGFNGDPCRGNHGFLHRRQWSDDGWHAVRLWTNNPSNDENGNRQLRHASAHLVQRGSANASAHLLPAAFV